MIRRAIADAWQSVAWCRIWLSILGVGFYQEDCLHSLFVDLVVLVLCHIPKKVLVGDADFRIVFHPMEILTSVNRA